MEFVVNDLRDYGRCLWCSLFLFVSAVGLGADEQSDWAEIQELAVYRGTPNYWTQAAQSRAEMGYDIFTGVAQGGHGGAILQRLVLLDVRLDAFLDKYPDSQYASDAKVMELDIAPHVAAASGQGFDRAQWMAGLASLASDPATTPRARARAEIIWIRFLLLRSKTQGIKPGTFEAMIDAMESYIVRHEKDWNSVALAMIGSELLAKRDPERAGAFLRWAQAGVDPADQKLVDDLDEALATLPLRSGPMEFSFTAMDGTEVSFADLRGQVVVVFFWSSWDNRCREIARRLAKLEKAYGDQGLAIVGISVDKNIHAAKSFARKTGMTWPHYATPGTKGNPLVDRYNIKVIPEVWVIDREGYLIRTRARWRMESHVARQLGVELEWEAGLE